MLDFTRYCSKYKLLISTSLYAAAQIVVTSVMAAPAIEYSGSVSPIPAPGLTSWNLGDNAELHVGNTGVGNLSVKGGASISVGTLHVAFGGIGGLIIDGQGSVVNTSNEFVVGEQRNGTVSVSNGARIVSYSEGPYGLTIGYDAVGTLTATGAGTTVTSNNIMVGAHNTGVLNIIDGAEVRGTLLVLGHETDARGTVTLSGGGTKWIGENGVYVGEFGNGTLNLSNRASINDKSLEIAFAPGSSGVVNVGGAQGQAARSAGELNVGTIGFGTIGAQSRGTLNINTAEGWTLSASLRGRGTINQLAGDTVLTGSSNTFTGVTNITGGTLQFGAGLANGTLGGLINTGVTAAQKGQLIFNRSSFVQQTNQITGTGSISQLGTGTTALTGMNSYSGGSDLKGGTLSVSREENLGDLAGALNFEGGALQITGTTMHATGRTINWSSDGGGFDIADANNIFVVDETIGAGGALIKRGAGTLILNGQNLYQGGTELNGGILSVASDVNLGALNGELRFTGGTLEITESMASGRGMTVTSVGGTISVDSGKSFTARDAIIDAGARGSFTKSGDGIMITTASNTYSGGTTLSDGVFQLGDGNADGSIIGNIVNNASLVVDNLGDTALDGAITGIGSLTQSGSGTLTLSGNNSYSGGTNFNSGIVSVAQQANLGDGEWNFNGGTLRITGTDFNSSSSVTNWGTAGGTFDIADAQNTFSSTDTFTGAGAMNKAGAGTLALSGNSSGFQGDVNVNAGTLRLDDASLGGSGGIVNVRPGGSLGGHGTIGSKATVASGADLFGQSGQTLTFLDDLTLDQGSNVDVTINGAPSKTELFYVGGNLSADGTLTINQNSNVDVGVYRIFHTEGVLTNHGMALAAGSSSDYHLQVVQSQNDINLIKTGGRHFSYWDGGVMSGDGIVHGGDGIWNSINSNWSDQNGNGNLPWDNNMFAVFQGIGGTVNVSNGFTPSVDGMQFFVDGYTIDGGSLDLGGTDNRIVVGDGTLDSSSMVATINSVLEGQGGFTKSGYGTLNLTGQNTYSGVTTVKEGTLELSDGGSIQNSEEVVLESTQYHQGQLLVNKNEDFTLTNKISGVGQVTKNGAGTTTFTGSSTFSGGLSVAGGTAKAGIIDHAFGSGKVRIASASTLDLADFNETIGGLDGLTPAAGNGHDGNIVLGSGTLTLNQALHGDYSGILSGSGGLVKNGDGDLVLYGSNIYSGETSVRKGALIQGAAGGLSGSSSYALSSNAEIDLGGFATNMASLSNGGNLIFGGVGGTQLAVAGDYIGAGGTLHMSAALGGDNSLADHLNVGGNTSGSTRIDLVNRQGFGDQTVNGIEIITVGGQSNGDFALNGDYVTKDGQQAIMTDSAYAYTLRKGLSDGDSDKNWYLVSQYSQNNPVDPNCQHGEVCPPPPPPGPRYSPAASVYESYTSSLQFLNRLPSLQQRVGDRYTNDFLSIAANQKGTLSVDAGSSATWGRIEGAHNRVKTGTTAGDIQQDINTYIMQAGVDGQFFGNNKGHLIAGLTGQYGSARANIDNVTGDGSGDINTHAWSLGATATWYGSSGFYLDSQAQATWFDSDLAADTRNRGLTHGNKAFGYGLGVEAGQRIALAPNWLIIPQAQLSWSSIDFDAFTDTYGARISNRNSDSLSGRIGIAVNHNRDFTGSDGRAVNASAYAITNLYQELLGDGRISYAGAHLVTNTDKTWAGIGLGGHYAWADSKYTIFGEGLVNASLNHFAQSYNLKANVGVKVNW